MSLLLAALLSVPIEWSAPPGCPAAEAARRDLQATLEQGTGIERIVVDVRATGDGVEMRVEVTGGGGSVERTIRLDSCAQSVDAAVVVVSLSMSPESEPEPEPRQIPEPPRIPEPEPRKILELEPGPVFVDSDEAAPRDPAKSSLPWVFDAAAGLLVGGLPRVGPFVRAGVGLTERLWLARFSVEHWIRRDESVPAPPDATLRVSVTAVRLEAGVRIPAGPMSVPLTGFLGAGLLAARGVGVARASQTFNVTALGGVRAGLVIPIAERVALTVGAEAALILPRRRFVLDGGLTLGSAGGLAGLFCAGVAFGPGAR